MKLLTDLGEACAEYQDGVFQQRWALKDLLPGNLHAAVDLAHEPIVGGAVELPIELEQLAHHPQIDGWLRVTETPNDLFNLSIDV